MATQGWAPRWPDVPSSQKRPRVLIWNQCFNADCYCNYWKQFNQNKTCLQTTQGPQVSSWWPLWKNSRRQSLGKARNEDHLFLCKGRAVHRPKPTQRSSLVLAPPGFVHRGLEGPPAPTTPPKMSSLIPPESGRWWDSSGSPVMPGTQQLHSSSEHPWSFCLATHSWESNELCDLHVWRSCCTHPLSLHSHSFVVSQLGRWVTCESETQPFNLLLDVVSLDTMWNSPVSGAKEVLVQFFWVLLLLCFLYNWGVEKSRFSWSSW